jgi:Flp pilus assembly protein TadG
MLSPVEAVTMLIRPSTLHSRFPRRAAHLVEMAIVAPVFFTFVLGLVELGRGLMASSMMGNAARLGCRTGVLPNKQNTDVNAAVDGFLQGQGITGYTTTIQVNGNAKTDVSSAQTGDTITVQVQIPVANVSWLPGLQYLSGSLTGMFAMPHE